MCSQLSCLTEVNGTQRAAGCTQAIVLRSWDEHSAASRESICRLTHITNPVMAVIPSVRNGEPPVFGREPAVTW
jgi:hypothetical protein